VFRISLFPLFSFLNYNMWTHLCLPNRDPLQLQMLSCLVLSLRLARLLLAKPPMILSQLALLSSQWRIFLETEIFPIFLIHVELSKSATAISGCPNVMNPNDR
jgi:hypothetical protein